MILYLDTSCLAKAYLEEAGSAEVREKMSRSSMTASSWIAYPEMHCAFSRRHREGTITAREHREQLDWFERDWADFMKIKCDERISRLAGEMASRHRLRGMDSIHLASAIQLRRQNQSGDFEFLSADIRLNEAAKKEKFHKLFSA